MARRSRSAGLELWGGIECTVNRVGDRYFDQLTFNGHTARCADLDRVAALGISVLRYPVLWEKVMPDRLGEGRWAWPDERLARLKSLGIRPILTLLHHGSGPRYTSLIDPEFPRQFARYATAVAERYPWVVDYTAINEPLTTARFSGLYGHWYPHGRDAATFVQCLLNQIRATALAMNEIRRVQPRARLILTEDVGQTASTPSLAYQADYENERRWLSMDLLCGRVAAGHPLWQWLRDSGADARLLSQMKEETCPPDVLGLNHYLTSNRYLDENMDAYPRASHGGNGRHAYADVEAVRVAHAPQVDRMALLRQMWDRYHRPLAVTESHLFGPREDQLGWLADAWNGALALREAGVDVKAVTAWSLLGTFDWHCMVTRCEGLYEAGAFDVQSGVPRPTAVASMIRALATSGRFRHPVLRGPRWWQRGSRSLYPPVRAAGPSCAVPRGGVLITGARGTLGRAFAQVCEQRGIGYTSVSRQDLDIADPMSVRAAMDRFTPWAVINTAGYVRVDAAEQDRERCYRDNVLGTAHLAQACAQRGIPYLTFSTDLVFDGQADHFVETSATRPLNYYGITKRDAEAAVRAAGGQGLVIRTSAFFGPWDNHNFVTQALRSLSAGAPMRAADNVWVSPTYVPDLVHAALDLLIDGEHGVWHVANQGAITWADLARTVARLAGLNTDLVQGCPACEMGWLAQRPERGILRSQRGQLLGALDSALARYFVEATTTTYKTAA